jgi:hypothetical protein
VDIDEAVQHVDAGLRDRWLDLGIERQRATIAAVFERITILPARRPGMPPMVEGIGRIDLKRVDIRWRA